MRCSQYQYYDYKGKICLYFNPFFGGNKLFSKTVSDTLKENDLIKRIDCQTFYSKQTINKRKYEADTTNTRYLFEYDDKKRVIHKLEINKQYKNFIDSITYDYTYFDENQIKTLERRNVSKNSNKYYSKEENFFDTHGKLVKNVATDQNESSIRVTETIHKGDTSIENTYFSNRKEQLRKGFMSVYYKNVSILHESYNENSKVEYRNKRLYRRRFHF
jgi:hypothetical protein